MYRYSGAEPGRFAVDGLWGKTPRDDPFFGRTRIPPRQPARSQVGRRYPTTDAAGGADASGRPAGCGAGGGDEIRGAGAVGGGFHRPPRLRGRRFTGIRRLPAAASPPAVLPAGSASPPGIAPNPVRAPRPLSTAAPRCSAGRPALRRPGRCAAGQKKISAVGASNPLTLRLAADGTTLGHRRLQGQRLRQQCRLQPRGREGAAAGFRPGDRQPHRCFLR